MDGVLVDSEEFMCEAAIRMFFEKGLLVKKEDAVSGIAAAKAAGCKCLALKTSFSADRLIHTDWVCHTLEDAPDDSINW
jgi:beta-phosphoglucomutase-like phosphatase (HAD superfamily)